MRKSTISLGLMMLSGCMSNDSLGAYGRTEINVENLTQISEGMDEAQVRQIMRNPHSEETIQLNEDQYDVWFYVTNPTVLGQTRMVHYNLTPITFLNDILESIGWDYYRALLKSRDNLKNISRLQMGMTQPQVRQLMRTPDKEEQITSEEGQYTILFYKTAPRGEGSPCEAGSNLIALTFKDDRLISTDCSSYSQRKSLPTSIPSSAPGQTEEKSLENVLKPTEAESPPTPAVPNPAPAPSNPDEAIPLETIPSDGSTANNEDDSKAKARKQKADEEKARVEKEKEGIDMTPEDDEILQRDNDLNFDQF